MSDFTSGLASLSISYKQTFIGHTDLHTCMNGSFPELIRPLDCMQRLPFLTPEPTVTLVTDAPLTQVLWMPQELLFHINGLELRASCWTYEMFITTIRDQVVQVFTSITTVTFYLNKQGGARSSQLYQDAIYL